MTGRHRRDDDPDDQQVAEAPVAGEDGSRAVEDVDADTGPHTNGRAPD